MVDRSFDDESWRVNHVMAPDQTYRFRVPIEELRSEVTRTEDVFVLAHFGIPRIALDDWRLHIAGMVECPKILTFEELCGFPKVEIESFINCAGFPADPTIATRNVSNARWAGTRLKDVLSAAGVHDDADFLWFSAPDRGTYQSWSSENYVKDLPRSRAMSDDVLLAYEMNGAPLTQTHGFPVRLFVPGFYGTNSVKWLCRIDAAPRRAPEVFTNELYNDPTHDGQDRAPVWEVPPEALITAPSSNTTVPGGPIEISGWCWGQHEIHTVDVSLDDGASWQSACVRPRHQMSWQRFTMQTSLQGPATYTLSARATDRIERSQPDSHARNSVHRIQLHVG